MTLRDIGICALLGAVGASLHADVTLWSQPHTGSGTLLYSGYWDPDGSDYDELLWDGFRLTTAGNLTQLRWRGGGTSVNTFELSIWPSIPAGIQPDVTATPLWRKHTTTNCSPVFAGVFNGVTLYDYAYTLPTSFALASDTPYWIRIVAWTPGIPAWGLATGSGGNGTNFHRGAAVTGDYRFYYQSGDAAITMLGTASNCSNPVITQNPSPVETCYSSGGTVTFTCAATGAGTLSYRWRLNGNPVYDGPNGGGHGGGAYISGATTNTLTIQMPSYWADAGNYDCVVSNGCGPSTTTAAALTIPFGAPFITTQPLPASTCAGGQVSFLAAAGNAPTSTVWRHDGVDLVDGTTAWGSVISGAATGTLTITGAQIQDAGQYTSAWSNICGTGESNGVALQISLCCPADFNGDNSVDFFDYLDFVNAFSSGDPAADFNADNSIDFFDYLDFVNAFAAGC